MAEKSRVANELERKLTEILSGKLPLPQSAESVQALLAGQREALLAQIEALIQAELRPIRQTLEALCSSLPQMLAELAAARPVQDERPPDEPAAAQTEPPVDPSPAEAPVAPGEISDITDLSELMSSEELAQILKKKGR